MKTRERGRIVEIPMVTKIRRLEKVVEEEERVEDSVTGV
ncbi:hypothetical protein A2U01_0106248, partial [Trifolium medium]|nr:hypothetical protein [Trifolium medium]